MGGALTGKCVFSGEERNKHECALVNEWGLGFLYVRPDSRADPFGSKNISKLAKF